ncbi:inner centromere protein A-like [Porphyrio hochstetteri]
MAEADGPTRLLEVCGQRLSRFLCDAEHKHLAWLREAEEQGMRMLDSSFGAEPKLMRKTPSQRRRPRKRQSSCLRDENKEPNRRRLSRRRSSVRLVSSKASSQRRLSREQAQQPSRQGQEVSVPGAVTAELPVLAGTQLAEAPVAKMDTWDAGSGDAACEAGTGELLPKGDVGAELQDVSSVTVLPGGQTAGDREETPKTKVSSSAPKAARNGDPDVLQDWSSQGLGKVLFQDSDSKTNAAQSKTHRCSGRRSIVGGPPKSCRASLAKKYTSKRGSRIRRSLSRAASKKAAAGESSSASSSVSCQSSSEVSEEDDVTSSMRPGLQQDPPSAKTPKDILIPSESTQAASPPARHLLPPEQQPGKSEGSSVNPSSEPRSENQEQPCCAKAQGNPSCIWTRSCKQAMGVLWNRQQLGKGHNLPSDDKHKNSANRTPPPCSPASKVVRPWKNFLQAVQRNQLLASPGPAGRGGVGKNFIKRSTPTRPDLKEKERQRLESLRKKQEAEEQRRKKVEEEKMRRQAEMKQKREERMRKALQTQERLEQMEEEKKKRMEQKILQSDEKVRLLQARDEKAAEERSRGKLPKKHGEADARKQKAPRVEEDEFEQQEPLQRRRQLEVNEKGKKVLELKNLVEQQQLEQAKERDHKQRGKEKGPQPQLESAMFTGKNRKEEESRKLLNEQPGQEKRAKQPEPIAAASNAGLKAVKEEDGLREPQCQWGEEKKIGQPKVLTAASGMGLSKTMKKSISMSCLEPPKGMMESTSLKANENNYGLDLNSDDSTDDENEPRKPIPAWADGSPLNQAILHQYHHPVNTDQLFGLIPSPKLEDIFGKSKPRYFKRTSSAVWHSPPGTKSTCSSSYSFKS